MTSVTSAERKGMLPALRYALLAPTLLALACGEQAPPSVSRTVRNVGTSNGTTFNGISYGGYSLQTTYLSYYYAPTMFYMPSALLLDPYAGVGPNGQSLSAADLAAVGLPEDVTSGFDLVGKVLTGRMENGRPAALRIDTTTLDRGFFAYQVSVATANEDGEYEDAAPLCGYDASGAPIPALAVPGVWDMRAGEIGGGSWSAQTGEFTFACRGSSIAKCVELGYAPEMNEGEAPNARYLMACVRMLRADYCGDGTSWTTNGRMIDVWDNRDTNVKTEENWHLEAGWSPGGAVCLTDARYTFPEHSPVPFCETRLRLTSCNTWEQKFSILFNSYPREESAADSNGTSSSNDSTSWSWWNWGSSDNSSDHESNQSDEDSDESDEDSDDD